MPEEKWNIIWNGCRPGEMKEDDIGPYHERNCVGGVAEFNNLQEVHDWSGDQSVSFGEDGGDFRIRGGWRGSFEDLKKGRTRFLSEKELVIELNAVEKE